MKKKTPEEFYKKFKKLIEKELPDECELAYDTGFCQVFVLRKGAKLIEHKTGSGCGTSWHGVCSPVAEPSSCDGYERSFVVGDGIDINMAAVQGETF